MKKPSGLIYGVSGRQEIFPAGGGVPDGVGEGKGKGAGDGVGKTVGVFVGRGGANIGSTNAVSSPPASGVSSEVNPREGIVIRISVME